MQEQLIAELVREQLLLTRLAVHDVAPTGRQAALDRSALILLARLHAQGPMTVAELAEAFELDISTVHRQATAAMKGGLLERIPDPDGGLARKLRPTDEGIARLATELSARRQGFHRLLDNWPQAEVAEFARYLRRFNEAVENMRGTPWPRD